jgi:hypothetical protein
MNLMCQPEFYLDASSSMDENGLKDNSAEFLKKYLVGFENHINGK